MTRVDTSNTYSQRCIEPGAKIRGTHTKNSPAAAMPAAAVKTHLKLPEVRPRVSVVRGHAVVTEAEHKGEEEAAAALGHGEKR